MAGAQVLQVLPVLVIDGQSGVGMSDGNNPSTLSSFKSSFYLVNAMLSDARDADSTSLIAPTIVSYSDRRLKDLVERGVRRPGTTAGKPADDLRLESFAAVVVNDVPGLDCSVQNRLNDYARSGHGVWYILGRRTDRTFIRDQLAASNLLHLDVQEQQGAAEKPVAIDVKDASHVTLAPFTSADRNVLTGMTTLRWWALKPRDADAQVLLATQTGDPLVMDRPVGSNGGRVMVWTSPVDSTSGWNNWTTLRSFAPMVNVTLYHLASGQTKGQENKRLDSGQPLVWTSPSIRYAGGATDDSGGTRGNEKPELVFADGTVTPLIRSAEVVLPDGTKSQIRPITRDGRQILRFSDTFLPGKYEVRFDQTALKPVYFGVGIDRRELDETALNDEDRKWFSADDHKFIERSIAAADLSVALGGGNKGSQIWPYIAGLLLGILLFETFMTYWMIRRQNCPAVALGVVPVAGV